VEIFKVPKKDISDESTEQFDDQIVITPARSPITLKNSSNIVENESKTKVLQPSYISNSHSRNYYHNDNPSNYFPYKSKFNSYPFHSQYYPTYGNPLYGSYYY